MPLAIVKYPDPVLKTRARELTEDEIKTWRTSDGTDLAALGKEMSALMDASNGVGLAAPQVGLGIRFFVARIGEKTVALANPKISVPKGAALVSGEEGCLSVPGKRASVYRPDKLQVAAFEGRPGRSVPVRLSVTEGNARVVCHEVDHLDGVLFFERSEEQRRQQEALAAEREVKRAEALKKRAQEKAKEADNVLPAAGKKDEEGPPFEFNPESIIEMSKGCDRRTRLAIRDALRYGGDTVSV